MRIGWSRNAQAARRASASRRAATVRRASASGSAPASLATAAPRLALSAAVCLALLYVACGAANCQEAPARQKDTRRGEGVNTLLDRASLLISQGRCEDAIPVLENLTMRFPRIAPAKEMLANCYLKAGRAQDAVPLLEGCLEEEPGNPLYIRYLGQAYIDLGQKDKGLKVWHSILSDDPKSAALYGTVAKTEQEAGLYEEAVETLRGGLKFKQMSDYYAREIIRLDRILGRDEEAFREALLLVGRREGALESELAVAADIFKASQRKERLVAVVDSAAAVGDGGKGVFRTLKTIILIEGGRYDEVRRELFGSGAPPLREEEFYSLLNNMRQLSDRESDDRFAQLYGDMMQHFLERYGSSMLAPGVMLMMASSKRNAARSAGPAREKLLDEALALADAVKRHRLGGPYMEQALMFKARVLFDDLHRPNEALQELGGIGWRSYARTAETEELRVRILLTLKSAEEATGNLERLAHQADSSLAILGTFGIGRLEFLTGKYGEAVKTLSELAEKHPSSKWANDALELAMEIKGAMPEGSGALDLCRSAVLASERGNDAAAIDTLAALEGRYPSSSLVPRAIFMKAELEEALGISSAVPAPRSAVPDKSPASSQMLDAARADFTRLAERFPLHDLAPRALEKLAALAERGSSGEALRQYGELMKRYPQYPFMERVRERYIALGKSAPPTTPGPQKKGTK